MGEIVERFETEVRRGMMQVTIMCMLEEEHYGYDIIRDLQEVGIDVDDGTLYPLLRRLEDEKLLASRWETGGPRPRKYYVITEYGRDVREKMLASLGSMSAALATMEGRMRGKAKCMKDGSTITSERSQKTWASGKVPKSAPS